MVDRKTLKKILDSNYKKKSIFTSKSNVLKLLKKQVKLSKIENILDFTLSDWKKNKKLILIKISKRFPNKKIIIRSSVIGEDSEETSQAGRYESILNVNSNSKNQVSTSINNVINSYRQKKNLNSHNQILVQTQTLDIITSGVIFTRTSDLGSPYYMINYEDGKSTVGVTQGSINKIIKISRSTNDRTLPKKWRSLLSATKEIESIIHSDSLDIEFGITKNRAIVIFQVRPITSLQKIKSKTPDLQIRNKINQNIKKFTKIKKTRKIPGKHLIFSDMTDWNPAEIIGNNPNELDYSLYNFLIMKDSWYKGRSILGYQKFYPHSLMVKFGNKPYVDVRVSFNSLIPDSFGSKLTQKLMNFYLEKLMKNPQLHDKAEFEILFTCYDLSLEQRLKELKNFNFTKIELEKIHNQLLFFTQKIINEFPKTSTNCKEAIEKMAQNRLLYMKKLTKTQNYTSKLQTAEILLNNCRDFGVIPFSLMARIAFISTAFLNSFVAQGHLSQKSVGKFMNSLETPLSKFQNDLTKFSNKKITKKQFLEKYGHLRPGTYDITIDRYDKKNPFLNHIKFHNSKSSSIYDLNSKRIERLLKSNNFEISIDDFFSFIRNSLIMREELKFEFTRNLSNALELIAEAGKDLGFSRKDIAYLSIDTIFSFYKKYPKSKLKLLLRKKIEERKYQSKINNYLVLPSIIRSKNDFELIEYYSSKPNYITEKTISSETVNLNTNGEMSNLENKIILLEQADPGYDWIFTRNPAGLITKYGGVASHMSIRCSEVGLAAAIGCGEIIYERLRNASKVLLDCKNHQIIVLEHKKHDEYIEQKKIYKSLGYIK